MTEKELYLKIKMLLLEQEITETDIAYKIGINQGNFNRKLNAGTLRYLEVEKLLNALGYRLEWVQEEK